MRLPFIAALVCCLLAIEVAGCANSAGPLSFWPWRRSSSEGVPGVTAPYERIASLRKLAGKAKWASAEKKRQVSAELARDIKTEGDPLIRAEIVRALEEYPSEESDAVLGFALHDPDADVRTAACKALGKRGGAEAAALLAGTLGGDIDKDVRLAAARALGDTKDAAAVAPLAQALDDKDPAMQVRAASSLSQITGKDFGVDVHGWQQYVRNELPGLQRPAVVAGGGKQSF
jgi:HEAT repeat protein